MGLTRLAITRPVTILMLVLALVILGLQSRERLPVDLYPDVEFPIIVVSTIYAGTGPEEIETLISKPIEDAVSSISGLKKLTSTSSEGVSLVVMEYELGTDLDEVTADVRSKLDALRNALPDDAKAPVVMKADVGAMPVISLSMSSQRRTPMELREMADDILKDSLGQLSGVASVSVSGGDVREVRIEVDKNRLEAYGLSINQVVGALQAENLNLPSGSIEETQRTSSIRVMGEFTRPSEIRQVRLAAATHPDLTIDDIAIVRDTVAKASSYTRVDGEPSVALSVQKQTDANTVKVVDEVRKELEKLTGKEYAEKNLLEKMMAGKAGKREGVLPADVQVTVAMDQSVFIRETLEDVNRSLIEGALLAVAIVFLFLHSLRGTFIVSLAIPTSMIATFLVMELMGFSINMMSMMGMSLCVGILVDDSIVVLENIHRHLRNGLSPTDAAIKGRTEIGLAALTITFVDVVVFVPVAFMGGIVGQFFRQFGIVVAAATLFSLFISFTLTPMLASRWLKPHDAEEEEAARQSANPGLFARFTNAWERNYGKVEIFYRNLLAWALDHRAVVICTGLMVMLASIAVGMEKPNVTQLLIGIMVLAVGAAIFYGLWFPIYLIRSSVWRVLYTVPILVVSVIASTMLPKIAQLESPMFVVLLLMVMLAVMAYIFTGKRETTGLSRSNSATRPVLTTLALLALVVVFLPGKLTMQFQPQVDDRAFSITIEQAVGTSLQITDQTTMQIETALFDSKLYPETKTVFSTTGSNGGGGMMNISSSGSDMAQISVELKDNEDIGVSEVRGMLMQFGLMKSPLRRTDEVVRDINERFGHLPGVKVTAAMGGDSGAGGAPLSIEISGADHARMLRVAEQVEQIVKNVDGTYSSQLSWRQGRPEVQAVIDRDRAAQYGISVAQIASALRTSLEGDTSSKYREGGKEYDIRVFLPEEQRGSTNQLPNMVVGTTSTGSAVYLIDVAKPKDATGPTKVERANRQRAVTVQSQLSEGFALGNVRQLIDAEIKKLDTRGVTVTWGGDAEAMDESFTNMLNALGLSVALVFMLMAALFESLLFPLIIMLSVPQAMAGAIFAITTTGKSLDIVTMIGIIMLVGLVTKNAILMVDYTNTLRNEQRMSRRDALLEAGPTRLRPILMTTLAMIFGMLPTAMALSKGAEFRQPMAIAVIGGLVVSMFLTLIMVPSFYEIMDDIGAGIARAKDRVIKRLRV